MAWSDDFVSAAPAIKLLTPLDIAAEKLEKAKEIAIASNNDQSVIDGIEKRLEAIAQLAPLMRNARFQTALAAARSCYSGDLVTHADVLLPEDLEALGVKPRAERLPDEKKSPKERMDEQAKLLDKIAKDTWGARHHTPYMHDNLVFKMDNISRQAIWSVFHEHPFYNSEQVSQRYKKMSVDKVLIPRLPAEAQAVFREAVEFAFKLYEDFRGDLLYPVARDAYLGRFPAKDEKDAKPTILKKTQEVARYFLPIATHAHMYHSVNAITLARYWRVSAGPDAPTEVSRIVQLMVDEIKKQDPRLYELMEGPLPRDQMHESAQYERFPDDLRIAAWTADFDNRLGADRRSRLVGYDPYALHRITDAFWDMQGLIPGTLLAHNQALHFLFSPALNKQRAEQLTLDHVQKLSRAKYACHLDFLVKLSHTADSQAQRQRMSPATRPVFDQVVGSKPDYITPVLVNAVGGIAVERYKEGMERLWGYRNKLLEMGVAHEMANYLLPNAVALRYTECVEMLDFLQKDEKRECLNAQEEIGRITLEQRQDVEAAFPELKDEGYFGPPCYLRLQAGINPPCPEGHLFCGVPVWRGLDKEEQHRPAGGKFAIEEQQRSRRI
jgi:thymidylate synthase ThyX